MKKIVILQDYLRNGGTERQSVHLARALAARGNDVTLLTFRPGGPLSSNPQPEIHNPKSEIRNPKSLALQPFDTHLDFFAPRLVPTLRRIAPDIILCMGRMANCKAARIARALPRAAVISTMRTGKKLPRAYVRSFHATRHIIANSHEAARLLRETHAIPAEKITVIHNALLVNTPHAASPPSKSNTGILPVFPSGTGDSPVLPSNTGILPVGSSGTGDSPVHPSNTGILPVLRLLCVAMFRPEKNHRELLEIFSKLPAHSDFGRGTWDAGLGTPASSGLELHLAGDGPELAPCRALAQRLNIAARVHFHGYVADPAPFYRDAAPPNATIAVLASRCESLPNFLVEAHARGIPSVAYATGGVAECGGIAIPTGDQPAFLAALARLASAPGAAAARAAESARVAAHAREHFSPETQLRHYLALFDKLMS